MTRKSQDTIKLDPDRINALLGTEITAEKMMDIFRALEFEVDPNTMIMKIPSFRSDIESVADLSEEVARFYDYNNIKPSLLSGRNPCGEEELQAAHGGCDPEYHVCMWYE